MWFNVQSFNVTYQATFSQLAFPLTGPVGGVNAIKTFYQEINPRFSINTEDIRLYSGSSMADLKMRLLLFGGLGEIELAPERLQATFKNAVKADDLTLIKDCIVLSLNALASWWPEVKFREELLQFMAFLKLKDAQERGIARFLDELMPAVGKKEMSAKDFGASELHYQPNYVFADSKAGWRVDLHLYQSQFVDETLILAGTSTYKAGGIMETIEKKFDHTLRVSQSFLMQHGLEFPTAAR
jgi:hypothetical protein